MLLPRNLQVQAAYGQCLALRLIYSHSEGQTNKIEAFGIHGKGTISPSNLAVKIVASRTFPVIPFMIQRIPLHNLGGFKLSNRIIGEPIFNRRLCGGLPGISRQF